MATTGSLSHRGTLYLDGESKGHPVKVRAHALGLMLDRPDETSALPYAELRVREAGFEGRHLILERPGDRPLSLVLPIEALEDLRSFCRDETFSERLHAVGRSPGLGWTRWVTGAAAVLASLGVIGGLVYGAYRLAIEEAIAHFPSDWEVSMGQAAIHDQLASEVHTPLVTRAVAQMGERLLTTAGHRPYPFKFHVVESPEVNAFALPGGEVIVYTGLIKAARTPDEVAGVLAHEIEHVLLRHGVRRLVEGLGIQVASGVLLGHGSVLLPGVAGHLLTLRFDRAQEAEADREGARLLHAAGLTTDGLISFFDRLAREDGDRVELLSTHPASAARSAELRRLVATLPPVSPRPLAIDWRAVRGAIP